MTCMAQFQPTRPARGATKASRLTSTLRLFQPTRPARGATSASRAAVGFIEVSTHAPRAGRDARRWPRPSGARCFNPRAPRGARRIGITGSACPWGFQPTRPARGATQPNCREIRCSPVSTHAPRAGRDPCTGAAMPTSGCFNPRAPRGARPGPHVVLHDLRRVSTHAPRAGRDFKATAGDTPTTSFNPRAPRGARRGRYMESRIAGVSTHAPRAGRDDAEGNLVMRVMVSTHAPRAGRDSVTSPSRQRT